MIKKLLLVLVIYNVITSNIIAQNVLVAKYTFLHVRDTTQPQNISTEEMILTTNNTKSLFKSFTYDSIMNSTDDKGYTIGENSAQINTVVKMPKITMDQLFFDYNTKEIVTIKPFIDETYGIKSPLQSIGWQLIDSTKQMGNLVCKKAVGEFRGRKYTCWYCPEISVQSGPWKLHGLPGLIISAVDEKNQVSFLLTSVTQSNDKDVLLPDLTFVTEKKFEEIVHSFKENPNAMLNRMSSNNAKLSIKPTPINVKSKSKFNNPLELN